MSIAARTLVSYRRAMDRVGETILIRRFSGTGPARPKVDVSVRARISEYQPDELIGGIEQARRRAIVLHDDLIKAGFALPITNSDFAVVQGKQHAIRVPDNMTRRVAGVTIAYELQIIG